MTQLFVLDRNKWKHLIVWGEKMSSSQCKNAIYKMYLEIILNIYIYV